MSLVVKHSEEVICDICHKKIEQIPYEGLFGDRFTMRKGIFGKELHADICFGCRQKIFMANKKEGGEHGK